jgi:hypothetical protein
MSYDINLLIRFLPDKSGLEMTFYPILQISNPIEISNEPSMKNDASLLIKLMIIVYCLIVLCRKLEACVTVRDGLLFGS